MLYNTNDINGSLSWHFLPIINLQMQLQVSLFFFRLEHWRRSENSRTPWKRLKWPRWFRRNTRQSFKNIRRKSSWRKKKLFLIRNNLLRNDWKIPFFQLEIFLHRNNLNDYLWKWTIRNEYEKTFDLCLWCFLLYSYFIIGHVWTFEFGVAILTLNYSWILYWDLLAFI